MRETFRNDLPLGTTLNVVVTDRRSGTHRFLHIAGVKQFAITRVVCPYAGEAVRLQFDTNRQCIALCFAEPLPQRLRFFHNAELVLHVVSNFVRYHVGLGKVTGCLEALLQRTVKREIDVHALIERTVKRPHRRLTGATRRTRCAFEDHDLGFAIFAAQLSEQCVPGFLGIEQHARNELAKLIGRRFCRALRRSRLLHRLCRLGEAENDARLTSKQLPDDAEDHSADAPAD